MGQGRVAAQLNVNLVKEHTPDLNWMAREPTSFLFRSGYKLELIIQAGTYDSSINCAGEGDLISAIKYVNFHCLSSLSLNISVYTLPAP